VSVTMLLGLAAGAFRFHAGAGLGHSVVWKADLRGVETSETVNAYISADKILDFFGRPNGIQLMAAMDRPVDLGGLPLRARLAYVRREVDWYECWAGPGARLHCVTTDWHQIAVGLAYPLGGDRS